MLRNILFGLAFFAFTSLYSQIVFEKGYFISNNGERTDCLIKNLDWKNNPTEFSYKVSESSQTKIASINDIAEFGFENDLRFLRSKVDIDRASDLTGELTSSKNPTYIQETLFLKQLVSGDANLFFYENGNLRKFFYNKGANQIIPLIYKRYLVNTSNLAKNTRFRQQLLSDLNCEEVPKNQIANLDYKQEDLVKIFELYNHCKNPEFVQGNNNKKRDFLNLSLRPGINFSSFKLLHRNSLTGDLTGKATSFRMGAELELLLPFNKNKWAVTLEPFYRSHSSETENDDYKSIVEYKAITLSFGIRHYMFLNDKTKLFFNGQFGIDFPSNSGVEFETKAGFAQLPNLPIEGSIIDNYWAIGAGLKLNDKIGVELRYELNQNALVGYDFWRSEYGGVAIIVGYNFL